MDTHYRINRPDAIAMAVGYARNKKIQKKIESGELQLRPK